MFTLRHSIVVHAPIERLFALSTSLEVVKRELHMNAVAGRTQGLVTGGDTVRWEGTQLGFRNFHVSLIPPETWAPPYFFQDRMLEGRFSHFEHDHRFTQVPEGTRLDDEVRFAVKLLWGGPLTARVVLQPHIRKLLRRRFLLLKSLAETEEWHRYLDPFVALETSPEQQPV